MSVLLTFRVPSDAISFGRAARAAGVSVTVDPLVPLESGTRSIHVEGAADADFATFEQELHATGNVSEFSVLDEHEDSRRYSLSWTNDAGSMFADLRDAGAHVLSAGGNGDYWEFETRFQTQDDLAAFSDQRQARDSPLEVLSLQKDGLRENAAFGLTDDQHETLLAALDAGFYDVPRDTTTVELAETLGISDQSLSERLRRAHAALIENALR
ncbi:helix-turn-helix domain-containing protein [Salarchaeum japonicum]|uniref:Helix-turn-helix domain-containing protein n=1 Tax=Salarchaeum japonicum TaxID=555573 RepID=A0AAV3SYT9_9EURY|nr:helix-turn-helix domain-containing protein [Salarchaeum japonicum]